MALYIPHSIFHLARLLYVRPESFGPYYIHNNNVLCARTLYRSKDSLVISVTNSGLGHLRSITGGGK